MTKFFSAITVAFSIASVAGAASAQTSSLRYRDLDLATPRGVQTLQNRIAQLAAQACAGEQATGSRTTGGVGACERDVRRSALQALPDAIREQVRSTEQANTLVSAR